MQVINKMVLEIYKKIAKNASELSKHLKTKSLSARDVQTAVKLVVPGELQKHCITEMTRAVTKYKNYVDSK